MPFPLIDFLRTNNILTQLFLSHKGLNSENVFKQTYRTQNYHLRLIYVMVVDHPQKQF